MTLIMAVCPDNHSDSLSAETAHLPPISTPSCLALDSGLHLPQPEVYFISAPFMAHALVFYLKSSAVAQGHVRFLVFPLQVLQF